MIDIVIQMMWMVQNACNKDWKERDVKRYKKGSVKNSISSPGG